MKGRLFKTTIAGAALLALFATVMAAAGAAPKSVGAAPDTVTITGVVTGHGGSGSRAWSSPGVSGAIIAVEDSVQTATTAADGTYSLTATVPPVAPYYAGKAITARHKWYRTGRKLLSSDAFQVKTFNLTVKGTRFLVTVKRGSKRIKGARVSCFGKRATTNRRGVATLRRLQLKPQTKYTVRITKSGYRTSNFKVRSRPGGTVKITKHIRKR